MTGRENCNKERGAKSMSAAPNLHLLPLNARTMETQKSASKNNDANKLMRSHLPGTMNPPHLVIFPLRVIFFNLLFFDAGPYILMSHSNRIEDSIQFHSHYPLCISSSFQKCD